ncbi:hypothetical protein CDLVIII_1327 [Clostridium sp. DL-VIII]|uniref:hypothetical protein n=1 Tax=Clostridium sp. DL-VIII TaxID=641107 RepID=UPI00023AF7BE|nr:hypothetical protein [Clostridium sp. DL-VIII]EHI98026.1 hypothetical protein CDLVIII_1327 [Clostridium sp. DL-VIII]
MKNKKDILNLVNGIINNSEYKEAIENFIKLVPGIVMMHRAVYEEMKKQKYSEEQAFEFASEYILILQHSSNK